MTPVAVREVGKLCLTAEKRGQVFFSLRWMLFSRSESEVLKTNNKAFEQLVTSMCEHAEVQEELEILRRE